jgi:sec-independent protein translocase protein TatA
MFLGIFNIGMGEFVIILIIGLLLFGRKLPSIARSLGSSVVEFKKGLKGVKDDVDPNNPNYPPQQQQLPPGGSYDQNAQRFPNYAASSGTQAQHPGAQPPAYQQAAPAAHANGVIDAHATVKPVEPAKV